MLCKTPRCIYPSLFNHFWDIASYWSKMRHFHTASLFSGPANFAKILIYTKLEWMGYRVVKKAWQYLQPFWYNISVWQTNGRTDRQTDRQTCRRPAYSYKNLAIANRSRVSCINTNNYIMTLKSGLEVRSLKVIENGTIWKLGYGFLFAFYHGLYGSTSCYISHWP